MRKFASSVSLLLALGAVGVVTSAASSAHAGTFSGRIAAATCAVIYAPTDSLLPSQYQQVQTLRVQNYAHTGFINNQVDSTHPYTYVDVACPVNSWTSTPTGGTAVPIQIQNITNITAYLMTNANTAAIAAKACYRDMGGTVAGCANLTAPAPGTTPTIQVSNPFPTGLSNLVGDVLMTIGSSYNSGSPVWSGLVGFTYTGSY